MEKTAELPVSKMAENLIGSEIIKLGNEINERIRKGEKIYNFTIGDFNTKFFPLPKELKQEIINAYTNDETNYPAANGMVELRESVSAFLQRKQGLTFSPEQILIAGGARPLIYAAYQTLVDPNDHVLFPVPSWNNNHYTHLSHAKQLFVETKAENNFMPTAKELKPFIDKVTLISLCSPLNPTGTTFTAEGLAEICDLIIEENSRRGEDEKPLYLMYDQIYWTLTYGETEHVDPVSLRPEMAPYTVFIDGLSKAFAATGVRVGWAMGPEKIINKMKSILGHVGAWSPKAEQIGTAKYLKNETAVDHFIEDIQIRLHERLNGLYQGLLELKNAGYAVNAIQPQAAIYLTVQFNLIGKKTPAGNWLEKTEDITQFILDEAKIALVPFYAFGASKDSTWYRLSVGTVDTNEIKTVISKLRTALEKLN